MRSSIILLISLLLILSAKGQDTIITNKGDTIFCKITRLSEQYIHYLIVEQSLRSRIPRDQVQSFTQAVEEIPKKETINAVSTPIGAQEPEVEEPSFSPLDEFEDLNIWRFALNGGYTYQFGGYSEHPSDYQKQVRSLFNFGGEAHYFTSSTFGFGLKFNRISTGTSAETLFNVTDVQETISFTYVAFSLINRQASVYDDNLLYYEVSAGLISYLDDGFINGFPYEEKGRTLGVNFEIGYDFLINSSYAVGANLGVNIAHLNNLTVNGTNIPNADFGLSRVDLTIGVRMFK